MSSKSQVKSSAQRAIVKKIKDQYPLLSDEVLEAVMPKNKKIMMAKCQDHVNIAVTEEQKEPLFFNQRDGPFYPTLRLLHKLGDFMPILQIDEGAIKFVINGANLMCVGITSKGGKIPESLPADTPVQINAEGKEYPLAVGITKMSTDDMTRLNTGIAVEIIHSLGDGLWVVPQLD